MATAYDRDPVKTWSRGTAILLGGAAHPMLPFLGQDACAALEDAVVLGEEVTKADGVLQAIEAYEAMRVDRTAELVKGSRTAAKVAFVRSAAGRRLRNALSSRVPTTMRFRQFDEVIGKDGAFQSLE